MMTTIEAMTGGARAAASAPAMAVKIQMITGEGEGRAGAPEAWGAITATVVMITVAPAAMIMKGTSVLAAAADTTARGAAIKGTSALMNAPGMKAVVLLFAEGARRALTFAAATS